MRKKRSKSRHFRTRRKKFFRSPDRIPQNRPQTKLRLVLDLPKRALGQARPIARGQCADGPRPCPWVSCQYHLYLDVRPETGAVKINSAVPVERMAESCALDVAERGPHTAEEVARLVGISESAVLKIEQAALVKLRRKHDG